MRVFYLFCLLVGFFVVFFLVGFFVVVVVVVVWGLRYLKINFVSQLIIICLYVHILYNIKVIYQGL